MTHHTSDHVAQEDAAFEPQQIDRLYAAWLENGLDDHAALQLVTALRADANLRRRLQADFALHTSLLLTADQANPERAGRRLTWLTESNAHWRQAVACACKTASCTLLCLMISQTITSITSPKQPHNQGVTSRGRRCASRQSVYRSP